MKKKILSLVLVSAFIIIALAGCKNKDTTKTDNSPESDENLTENATTSDDFSGVETTVSAKGEVFIVTTETDKNGEAVTDGDGQNVTNTELVTDTQGEAVTVPASEINTKEENTTTKEASNLNNNSSKEETTTAKVVSSQAQSQTQPANTTTQPATTAKPTTAPTAAPTTAAPTQAPTTAPTQAPVTLSSINATVSGSYNVGDTVSKNNVTVIAKYSDGSSKTIASSDWSADNLKLNSTSNKITITYQGKSTSVTVSAAEVSKIPSNWKIIDWSGTNWDDEIVTYKMYSNGVYVFDFAEDCDLSLNNVDDCPKKYNAQRKAESGLYLVDYLGSDAKVSIPSSIDGYPVTCLMQTFYNDTNVVEVTIPTSVVALQDTFWKAQNLTKITISAGSKLTEDRAFASDSIFKTGGNHNSANPLPVYCEKAVADAIASWKHVSIIVYSLDGKTVYYQR